MLIDSVFSPLLADPFPDDQPEIPVAEIARGLDAIEKDSADRQYRVLVEEVQKLINRAYPLVKAGDIAGIGALTWAAPVRLQQPIYDCWRNGYRLGSEHMLAEMVASLPAGYSAARVLERFSIGPAEEAAISKLLNMEPKDLQPNSAMAEIVRRRAITLAGNFSKDQLDRLKADLIAATVPQDGVVISMRELEKRIQENLGVGKNRAEMIARTETTAVYNRGRIATAQESSLVSHMRFIAILDNRTTPYCRSRNGLLYPIGSTELAYSTPPLHPRCRSTLSPVMPDVNPRHAAYLQDPDRDPAIREVTPLPKGWRTGDTPSVPTTVAPKPATAVLPKPTPAAPKPVPFAEDAGVVVKSEKDINKVFTPAFKKELAKTDDLAVLQSFTGDSFLEINNDLRARSITPERQLQVDRINRALDKLPDFQGIVYRGITPEKLGQIDDLLKGFDVGKVVTFDAFTSASLSEDIARNYAGFNGTGGVTIAIRSKTGKPIYPISNNPQEKEVLFRNGAKFNVEKVEVGLKNGIRSAIVVLSEA